MASQRHKLAIYNYGATCYAYEEKQPAIGYIRQQPGPYVQPVGPAGGPLKGSTLSGPPLAALPAPTIDNPLLALAVILSGGGPFVPPDGVEGPGSEAPALDALSPYEAEIGGPDVTMHVYGSKFVDGSVIVFNGGDEPTTFVSGTEVTTGVKPSTASMVITVPVAVRNPGGQMSNELHFTFTAEPPPVTRKKGKK